MKIIDRASPNFDERTIEGDIGYIILHYTGMKSAEEAIARLTDADSKVSAHYTIDEDGTIYRHVDESKRAWHAGSSFWQDQNDLNSLSVGVEIVNPGHEWGYRAFTDVQIDAVIELCRGIMQRHDMDPENVLAHSDIAPARKEDPGELFPWKKLAIHGIGIWPDVSDEDKVKATGIIMERALTDFGYDPRVKFRDKLIAFQRHFVPEAFTDGSAGTENSLSRARLYTFLAGHLISG
jgi:N-acetylmuramoyl-L-alanine amidase